jgi:hypothetical protein
VLEPGIKADIGHALTARPGDPDGKEEAMSSGSATYEELRNRYKPESTRVLFVGESRPNGGTFFFNGNSNLYRHTRKAFETTFGQIYVDARAFLTAFSGAGFWLADLCPDPVDGLKGTPRRDVCTAGEPALGRLLTQLRPHTVIGVKLDLKSHIQRAITLAGDKPPVLHVLPFPLYQWAVRYEFELVQILSGIKNQI